MVDRVAQRHTAFIHDRGGQKRLFQIENPTQITYSRVRDDTSEADILLSPTERDRQMDQLSQIEPGRHEVHIYRGNKLAWCGPVNLPTSSNIFDQWEMTAKDITFYLDRMAMQSAYNNSYPNNDYVVSRMQTILRNEITDQDVEEAWNLLDHLHFHVRAGDAKTSAKTYKYQSTVFDHLDDLAARAGIDYTVIGRELHVWDTSRNAMGQSSVVGRDDFLAEPIIKKYGTELATRVIATDGQGGYGIAGGRDPYYGKWDIVVQAYDAETDKTKPTAAELRSQADLSLKGRNPTPLQLAVPSGTGLDPRSVLYDLDMLVPGLWVPVRMTEGSRVIQRMQKLQDVKVTDNADGETIAVSLYPASGFGANDEDGVDA